MREQIYINGKLMDQEEGKSASLVWQSPFFTDIDSIVSNRSNSVDFPNTRSNLKAIENCHLYGSGSVYAYRRHRVLYYRDGIQLFAGYGTLLSLTPTSIRFSFVWGSIEGFQKLLDTKLRDLTGDTSHVTWNAGTISSSKYFASNVQWPNGYAHPFLPVREVLSALQTASGVSLLNASIFNNYAIPLVTKKADEAAKRAQGAIISHTAVYNKDRGSGARYETRLALSTTMGDKDPHKLYISEGIFDVSEVSHLEITFHQGFRFSSGSFSWGTAISICRTDEDGDYVTVVASVPVSRSLVNGTYFYSVNGDYRVSIDTSEYEYLKIILSQEAVGYSTIANGSGSVVLVPDIDKDQDVIFGGSFPLWLNLPDWTGSQLLKNLMKLEGVFPSIEDDGIRFVSISSLYSNRKNAYDWTGRLIFTNRRPSEQQSTLSGYAQKNWCKYAEDSTVKSNYDASMDIDDESLEKEADLLTLDFAATDGGSSPVIYAYTRDNNDDVQFSEVTPRILQYTGVAGTVHTALSFAYMDWNSILQRKYLSYMAVLQRTRTIKASLLIDAVELSTLDMKTPVYSYETGHYYAITKLTTKSLDTAEVELLQLGAVASDNTPSSDEFEIAIVADLERGGYFISIPSLPNSVINSMISSGQYKLLLLRYGYTRKGVNRKRYDKVKQKERWTHTDRKKSYKRQRGGQCWRIIGRDILERLSGDIPSKSAAYKMYYNPGNLRHPTLVFDLLQTIELPSPGKVKVSRAGRIKNEAHRGKTELYVGLYHKNENGWDLCSNRVRVRGRSSDLKTLWDFSENNPTAY